jgi:hypothetical protein
MALKKKARLVDRLFRPKHDYLPGTTVFREIDVDRIASDLRLEERGAEDGAKNLPSTTSSRAAGTENEIIRQVKSYWDDAAQAARRAHDSYASRAAALLSATDIDSLRGTPGAVASGLAESARSDRDDLRSHYQRWLESSGDLDRFREREHIDRPERPGKPIAVQALVLLVAAGAELAINASVFASGDEFGLAGALLKVLAIPLLNIGVTFALVFAFARHINRHTLGAKLIGMLGIAMAILWAFGLNLAVAHWRDSLNATMSLDAGRIALERILTATFELQDLSSWVLFAIGCLASAAAAYEATICSDPHPGYSLRVRARDKAATVFQIARDNALARLDGISAQATESLKDHLKKAETAGARRPEYAQRVDALAEDLRAYREHLLNLAEDLTTRYREANQRSRGTEPPPRFEEPVELKLSTVNLPPIKLAATDAKLTGLLTKAMGEITEAQREAAAKLPTLEEWKAMEASQ